MLMRVLWAAVLAAVLVLAPGPAGADKLDDLTRALMQDPSYKVRVQAALVLGTLNDRRAVPALMQALRDENESVRGVAASSLGKLGDRAAASALSQVASGDASEFVRSQARKALDQFANAGTPEISAPVRGGAKFYLAVGFQGSGGRGGPQYNQLVRETLAKELAKLPAVTLSVGGGAPSAQVLSSKHLRGFIIDGTIERLSSSRQGGVQQIDCDLKAYVATYPDKSIKMMTTEGASLQGGGGPSEEQSAKRDCLSAAVEAVREDVGKFLRTVE
jgi:HEAT repeats